MIPVFEPDVGDEEIAAVADAIRRGEISGSSAPRSSHSSASSPTT